jgi:sigma-E factor negative regulatory protein RseB
MSIASTLNVQPGSVSFGECDSHVRSHTRRLPARAYGATAWICGLLAIFAFSIEDARAVDSGKEAKVWLDKIATSAQNVNYEGTFVYRRDDQLVSMHLIHVTGPDGEREQLVSLSGGQRVLLRSKEGVVCIFPGKNQITYNKGGLGKHFPSQLAAHVEDLEKNYHLSMGSNDRIAGRAARMLIVEPKDNYRYGYRIWVDKDTGLLLQSDLVNEHGNAVEQVMFTSIKVVDKPTPEMVKAVTMNDEMRKSLIATKEKTVSTNDMPWRITQMPSGFAMAEHYQHNNGKRNPVEQIVLTDGMATVSIFIERINENTAPPFKGVSHMGAVNAFGTVVDDHQLTVVGEVPAATVRLIGHSLNLTETAGR